MSVRSRLVERQQRRRRQALSRAVTSLPAVTKQAMLAAVEHDELIAGAYTDRAGRVCPMLAAHRRGARTDVRAFARAWDSFAHANRPRPARQREVEILKALLEESLASSSPDGGRAAAERRGRETVRF